VNEHSQQRLDAETPSGSRGYSTLRPRKYILLLGPDGADGTLATWPAPEADVAVRPLAGVTELLHVARSRAR
jgi:hypothetical protein